MGKGYALKRGIEKTSKKWNLTCDIDFSANPVYIKKWIKLNYINKKYNLRFEQRSKI